MKTFLLRVQATRRLPTVIRERLMRQMLDDDDWTVVTISTENADNASIGEFFPKEFVEGAAWRPMSTAPRDGTVVWLSTDNADDLPELGWYTPERSWTDEDGAHTERGHWQTSCWLLCDGDWGEGEPAPDCCRGWMPAQFPKPKASGF